MITRRFCLLFFIVTSLLIISLPANATQDTPTPQPVSPGLYNITTTSGGTERRFLLHVPANYQPGSPMPLIFVFHGRGSNAQETLLFSEMSDKAQEVGFFVVYPEALGTPQQWNFLAGAEERGEPNDLEFVRHLLALLSQRLDVDAARIYATGISNGGGMAYHLACQIPDQIAAVAQVAGMYPVPQLMLGGCTPNRPIPVMTIHGKADQVLPYEGEAGYLLPAPQWAANWAERNGCDSDPIVTFEEGEVTGQTWTNCSSNADVVLYTVENGGHTWFYDQETDNLAAPPTDINATDAIWDFFAAHPMTEASAEAPAQATPQAIDDLDDFTPKPGSFTATIESGDLTRRYLLHIPTGYDDNTATPLVFNFHGYGSNPEEYETYTGMSAKADEEGFVVVYPLGSGTPPEWFFWQEISDSRKPQDVQFVADLIDALTGKLNIDPARIYAAGFSNGGGMANRLACDLSNRIAAIAEVSGTYPYYERCQPTRPVPALAMHGTGDNVLPYEGQNLRLLAAPDWASHWADRNGCQMRGEITSENSTVTGRTWSDCVDGAEIKLYTIEGGGHVWPKRAIDATSAVWDFFKAHTLPTQPSPARVMPFADPAAGIEPVEFTPMTGNYAGEIITERIPRRYLVHIPPGYDPEGAPVPLVLNFHGLTADPRGQIQLSQMSEKADEEGFIVVYPEGYGDDNRARGWFYLPTENRAGQGLLPYDVKFISDLIDTLPNFLNIDPARIYATGMSNGAGFSNRLACDLADKIAAVAGVSGSYQYAAPCRPARPVPMMFFHGQEDKIAPYTGAPNVAYPIPELATQWAIRNGCDETPELIYQVGAAQGEAWTGCLDGAQIVLYTIEDGGHTWPGGTPIQASIDLGRTSPDVDATGTMWDFFAAHPMPDTPAEAVELAEDDALETGMTEALERQRPLEPGTYMTTLESGEYEREHILHIPAGYDDSTPIPLVIAYHGFGDEPVNFLIGSDLMRKADEEGFILVVPSGFGDPRAWASRPSEDHETPVDDVQYTQDLIEHLNEWFNIDPARIYATGFSNGGGMVNRLACDMADVFAAVAPVGGSYPSDDSACDPARPIPIFSIHGSADTVVPYEGDGGHYVDIQEWAAGWAERNDCKPEPATSEDQASYQAGNIKIKVQTWQKCDADLVLQTYIDWGHFWPPGAGPDDIWAFFEAHPMSEPTGESDEENGPSTGSSTGEIESNGETRTYRLYVPTGYDPEGEPVPLVVNMHGFASNARQQEQLSQMSEKAEEADFIVVYPQGLGVPPRWNLSPDNNDDLAFILDLVAHLQTQYHIDPARIYATGMSNGGGMANRLACNAADVFAAIAPVAGAYGYAEACEPSRPVPVVSFHGRDDSIVDYWEPTNAGSTELMPPTKWIKIWVELNDCLDGQLIEIDLYGDDPNDEMMSETWDVCEADAIVKLHTVESLDHLWPGGPDIPILGDAGSVPATDIIWEFFEAHPMPDTK